jgi:hypothetical protein
VSPSISSKFLLFIGLPSFLDLGNGEYYDKPWEITADIFGEVQHRNHPQTYIERGFSYLDEAKDFKSIKDLKGIVSYFLR